MQFSFEILNMCYTVVCIIDVDKPNVSSLAKQTIETLYMNNYLNA